MAKYCIICGNRKNGIEIEADYYVRFIKSFKKMLKIYKGNTLVVCRDCYPKYKAMREKFERRRVLYIALGVIFLVLLVLAGMSLRAFLEGLGILIFLFLASFLSYVPKLKKSEKNE
ncbi:MAG: hypothetical protein QXL16_01125 [Candidatus Micrarchaeaceae archaeon]